VRVPSEEEEQVRALHRQREQLVKVRKVLEAHGRSLMVNHGIEPVQQWWKRRAFAILVVLQWIKELLGKSQPVVLVLQQKIDQLTLKLQSAAQGGTTPFKGGKLSTWEGGMRAPCVIRWAGVIKPGTTANHRAAWEKMTSVIIDREIGEWRRFNNRRSGCQL